MEKELKQLNRRELVDVIYRMKKNEQRMQEEIESLHRELEDKRIRISNAGSIADAACDISRLLTAAQESADLYLREIECMKAETEAECARLIKEAEQKAEKILSDANKQ